MRYIVFSALLLVVLSMSMNAQNQMVDKVNLVDRSNSKRITIDKPASLANGKRLIFPSSAGAAEQVLAISAVSGTDVTLGWVTMSAGTATSSDRLTAAQTVTPPTEPTGLVVSVGANKSYRVVATVRCNRLTGGAASDNIKFKLSGPTGTTFVSLGVRCLDDETIASTFASASAASATTSAINPPNYDAHSYTVDGLVITGSNAGDVTLTVVDGASTTNQLTILTRSNMVLREIE